MSDGETGRIRLGGAAGRVGSGSGENKRRGAHLTVVPHIWRSLAPPLLPSTLFVRGPLRRGAEEKRDRESGRGERCAPSARAADFTGPGAESARTAVVPREAGAVGAAIREASRISGIFFQLNFNFSNIENLWDFFSTQL